MFFSICLLGNRFCIAKNRFARAPSLIVFKKEFFKFSERDGAVADAVFRVGINLCHRAAEFRDEKDGVVTETEGAAKFPRYDAALFAGEHAPGAVRENDGDDADEAGGAGVVGYVAHFFEQTQTALFVRKAGASVSGGYQAGRSSQSFHFESGIIRGYYAGHMLGSGGGFLKRVLFVGRAVLDGVEVQLHAER